METKKYECKLPTDGYQTGDIAILTDAYVENANAGEEMPRFVLAADQDAKAVNEPGEPDAPVVDTSGHIAQDIPVEQAGDPVTAATDGTVIDTNADTLRA